MFAILKKRQEGGSAGPIESLKREPDEGAEPFDALAAVAADMIEALEKKDSKLLKGALEALLMHFQDMDEEQDDQLLKGPQ